MSVARSGVRQRVFMGSPPHGATLRKRDDHVQKLLRGHRLDEAGDPFRITTSLA